MKKEFIIGTRSSQLALWQSNYVKQLIESINSSISIKLKPIITKGDIMIDKPLYSTNEYGFFCKEIENDLLNKKIDLAVHSLKDLAINIPNGLTIAAVLKRADVRDVLIAKTKPMKIQDLPENSTIATGSIRRKAQLLHLRKDINIIEIRGNIDTRIRKCLYTDCDGLILAAAGVERIGLQKYISSYLDINDFLPPAGQAALAIEIRDDDNEIEELVEKINCNDTFIATQAERDFMKAMEAGCHSPIAVYGYIIKDDLFLEAMVANHDGSDYCREKVSGSKFDSKNIAYSLAEILNEPFKKIKENSINY